MKKMTSKETVLAAYQNAYAHRCETGVKIYHAFTGSRLPSINGLLVTHIALSSTHRVEADAWDEAASLIESKEKRHGKRSEPMET